MPIDRTGSTGTTHVGSIDPTPADGTTTATTTPHADSGAGAVTRTGSGSGARSAVLAGLGSRTPAGGTPAAASEPAVKLDGFAAGVLPDGTIVGTAAGAGSPLEVLNALALRPADGAGPFDSIGGADKALLKKIAGKLADTHEGLRGEAPNEGTQLAWRQGRAASLHLMEAAAARAMELGDKPLAQSILRQLTAAIKQEPWRQVRDFAFESLVSRAEAKDLPEVKAARDAIYPPKPPYDKWVEDGKIDILMYIDDDGSLISDQLDFYKELGFKHTANADGSHTLKLKKDGDEPEVVITIPKKDGEPALFEKMADPKVDIIAYGGHAGYGHRVDDALRKGVGGTGEDKLVILMQCWGEGNIESLERAYPDAQMLSTTAMTDDNLDFTLMENLIHGFRNKQTWNQMERSTERDLKEWFGSDPEYNYTNMESHYFFPTTRSTLVKKYDRDGDGVNDANDHIFNVIYPKRVDASGGYDPVVQAVPKYALDGTALNKAVTDVSLSIRYNHLLDPSLESRLPWKADAWKPGGFFEPEAGDLRAFRFEKDADGNVAVALSTRFAHTQGEDLGRMLAYEAGLWLADEAGLTGADKVALGAGMLERLVHQQGSWYSASNALDEAHAEEALFMKRYGLEGFTFGQLMRDVGDPDPYGPADFAKVSARLSTLPGIAAAADKAPVRAGEEIAVPANLRFGDRSWLDQTELTAILHRLGVRGEITSHEPRWLEANQPNNVTAVVKDGDKHFIVGLGVDSTGLVTAASKVEGRHDALVEEPVVRILDDLSRQAGGDEAAGRLAYERARAQGKGRGDALQDAIAGLRPRLPANVQPSTSELTGLLHRGLVSPSAAREITAVIDRAFPQRP